MVKWEWCCVFLPPPGPIALLGKQIVTSFGSKGNSKIAGSQLWAWTSDQTKVQHVFSLCPVISANYNLPPPPSLCPPSYFFSFFHHPPLSTNLLFLSWHFCLFLPDSVVAEARSQTPLLAGCSVRIFCRCRGLYAALGKKSGWWGWVDTWIGEITDRTCSGGKPYPRQRRTSLLEMSENNNQGISPNLNWKPTNLSCSAPIVRWVLVISS